jgi:predicted nucleotidyltransferase
MERDTVLSKLSENRKLLTRYGVKEIRLFGSVARSQAKASSDVDLLVEFEPSAHIGLFEFSRLKCELSELLECEVDLATPDAIHKAIREDVLEKAIHVA